MPKAAGKSGRGGKSSKTAHVLNLLTETEHTPEEGGGQPTHLSSPPPAAPQLADNETVAQQIRDALEEDLAAELGIETQDPPAPQPEPALAAEPEPEFVPMQEVVPVVEAESANMVQGQPEAGPEPEPALQIEEPAEIPPAPPETEPAAAEETASGPAEEAAPPPPDKQEHGISCLNVMQALLEEKIDRYIKMFGMCTCPRCRVDVMALALTSLPAKYVVVREQEEIPMLTVYEGRYNTAIIAQLMWACKKVMENPRH